MGQSLSVDPSSPVAYLCWAERERETTSSLWQYSGPLSYGAAPECWSLFTRRIPLLGGERERQQAVSGSTLDLSAMGQPLSVDLCSPVAYLCWAERERDNKQSVAVLWTSQLWGSPWVLSPVHPSHTFAGRRERETTSSLWQHFRPLSYGAAPECWSLFTRRIPLLGGERERQQAVCGSTLDLSAMGQPLSVDLCSPVAYLCWVERERDNKQSVAVLWTSQLWGSPWVLISVHPSHTIAGWRERETTSSLWQYSGPLSYGAAPECWSLVHPSHTIAGRRERETTSSLWQYSGPLSYGAAPECWSLFTRRIPLLGGERERQQAVCGSTLDLSAMGQPLSVDLLFTRRIPLLGGERERQQAVCGSTLDLSAMGQPLSVDLCSPVAYHCWAERERDNKQSVAVLWTSQLWGSPWVLISVHPSHTIAGRRERETTSSLWQYSGPLSYGADPECWSLFTSRIPLLGGERERQQAVCGSTLDLSAMGQPLSVDLCSPVAYHCWAERERDNKQSVAVLWTSQLWGSPWVLISVHPSHTIAGWRERETTSSLWQYSGPLSYGAAPECWSLFTRRIPLLGGERERQQAVCGSTVDLSAMGQPLSVDLCSPVAYHCWVERERDNKQSVAVLWTSQLWGSPWVLISVHPSHTIAGWRERETTSSLWQYCGPLSYGAAPECWSLFTRRIPLLGGERERQQAVCGSTVDLSAMGQPLSVDLCSPVAYLCWVERERDNKQSVAVLWTSQLWGRPWVLISVHPSHTFAGRRERETTSSLWQYSGPLSYGAAPECWSLFTRRIPLLGGERERQQAVCGSTLDLSAMGQPLSVDLCSPVAYHCWVERERDNKQSVAVLWTSQLWGRPWVLISVHPSHTFAGRRERETTSSLWQYSGPLSYGAAPECWSLFTRRIPLLGGERERQQAVCGSTLDLSAMGQPLSVDLCSPVAYHCWVERERQQAVCGSTLDLSAMGQTLSVDLCSPVAYLCWAGRMLHLILPGSSRSTWQTFQSRLLSLVQLLLLARSRGKLTCTFCL